MSPVECPSVCAGCVANADIAEKAGEILGVPLSLGHSTESSAL